MNRTESVIRLNPYFFVSCLILTQKILISMGNFQGDVMPAFLDSRFHPASIINCNLKHGKIALGLSMFCFYWLIPWKISPNSNQIRKLRLMDQVRQVLRYHHYSYRDDWKKSSSILNKLTVFDLSGFQIFAAVKLHFYADSVFAANPENFFLQRIGYTAVFFEILHQFPGFIDKKAKLFLTFAAAHI